MTLAPHAGSDLTQNYMGGMMTGLEDFTADDLKVARLVIDQKKGVFKDSLSGMEFPKVHAITLGVVKQRVMWPSTVEDDSQPLCKSTDCNSGSPTTWLKPSENFPWKASGWEPTDFQKTDDGRINLPCSTCRFTQWKTHPDGKKPWCSMQHAVPILYGAADEDPYISAVMTFQRSSIPASQAYFAGFMSRSMPAFTAVCEITLNKLQRGQNDYFVPSLRVVGQTDPERHPELSEQYRTMREFLQRPPLARDENGEVIAAKISDSNTIQAQPSSFAADTWVPTATPVPVTPAQQVIATPVAIPVVPQQTTPASVIQPSPPISAGLDDDLPF